MKLSSWRIFGFIACVVAAITLSVSVSDGSEMFVVSASDNGDANYMISNGDGTFSSQESLPLASENGISGKSYGNGIGDFDNDGDLDYIMGIGFITGEIYVFEKFGPGNQFGLPASVASWAEGFYPNDMAVADFDEDGNLDFVLSFQFSPNCWLYLGDGNLGFTGPGTNPDPDPLLLIDAAESFSAGADAADFNGDGHADFIIAPYYSGQFYVHLGDGDGTFQTSTFDSNAGAAYFGAAVADFDDDGFVDLAASNSEFIDIYLGNGDGTFDFEYRIEDSEINQSPLDNYDFNSDGNQDLVVGNFGSDGEGVAVYLGNGDGTFMYLDTYWGGNSGQRFAISAPPGGSNKEPVAVVTPVYLEAIVGQEIVVDGSESYDEDGEIVNFSWDFGDVKTVSVLQLSLKKSDAGDDTSEASTSYIYNDAGTYTVTLTVTDDKGATASVQAEVQVSEVPVVPVKVNFFPRTLNLQSRDKWIWATIKVPAGYDARQIDDSKVCIFTGNASPIFAQSDYGRGFFAKVRRSVCRKKRSLTLKFDRQAVITAIGKSIGRISLNVEGQIYADDGWSKFEGSGTIRTIVKKNKKAYFYKLRKKQVERIVKYLAKKRESKNWKYYRH